MEVRNSILISVENLNKEDIMSKQKLLCNKYGPKVIEKFILSSPDGTSFELSRKSAMVLVDWLYELVALRNAADKYKEALNYIPSHLDSGK